MAKRLYIPALGALYVKLDPYVLTMLRVAMGLILIPHGCQKAFGWFGGLGFERFSQIFGNIGYKPGAFWTILVILTELGGGICLVLGLFTRVAALLLIIFMINAIWYTSGKGFFWTAGGAEYSILIAFVALVFLIRGGGKCSLDDKRSAEF
jgi:putative oxidoreductase